MGNSSSSTVTNKILNKSINKSDIEAVNEQVSNFITNKITKSAATCSQSSTTFQDVELGNITSSGAGSKIGSIDVSQDVSVTISLSCLQTSISQANISNDIATAIVNSVTSNVSQSALSKAISDAETSSKTGMGATAMGNKTDSTVNVDMTNISENVTNRKFVNAVSNTVANTVNDEAIKKAIQTQLTSQSISVKNITATGGGEIGNITFDQKSISTAIAKAIQETQTVATVVTKLSSTYGLMSSETTTQTTSADSSAKAKTTVKAGGLEDVIDSVGSAISKVFGSVALMYAVCGIVILCILFGCIYALSKSFSSPAPSPEIENQNPYGDEGAIGAEPVFDPSQPFDPNQPLNPSQPFDPNQPLNPNQPFDPSQPLNPNQQGTLGGGFKTNLLNVYRQSGKLFKNNVLVSRKFKV